MSLGTENSTIAPLPEAALERPPPVAAVEVEPATSRYPARVRCGQPFEVRVAAVSPPGTPPLSGVLRIRRSLSPHWEELPLHAEGEGSFQTRWTPRATGDYEWCVELWPGAPDDLYRRGSSGSDQLHLLRVDRADLDESRWFAAPRAPLAQVAGGLPADAAGGILLLAPLCPLDPNGAPGRDGHGHYSIDPELGDTQSFAALSTAAGAADHRIALTVPLRCSTEHPFRKRFPHSFTGGGDTPDFVALGWRDLWEAWERVFRFWLVQGIGIFHIPNPEAAPVAFWQALLDSLRSDFPDIALTVPEGVSAPLRRHLVGAGLFIAPAATALGSDGADPGAVESADPVLSPLGLLEPVDEPSPSAQGERHRPPAPAPITPPTVDEIGCSCSNPALTVVVRRRADGAEVMLVENTAPERSQSGHIHFPGDQLGLVEHDRYYLRDLADGRAYRWSGTTNFLSLAPGDTAKSYRIERN